MLPIFRELCDWMRFEVNCVKSHLCIISEGLNNNPLFTRVSVQSNRCACGVMFTPKTEKCTLLIMLYITQNAPVPK